MAAERIVATDLRPGEGEELVEVLDPEALAAALAADAGVAGVTTRDGSVFVVLAPCADRDLVLTAAAEAAAAVDELVIAAAARPVA